MSLYRTHRPRSFAEVVGQDPIVTTLERALEQDRVSHAYLFAGSRGTGKTSVARILAKKLLTRGIQDPLLQKQIERSVDEGTLVDLLEIDAASNRGIDDIRNLIEKIQFAPIVSGAKVYIIDEAHMLTKEAFNALLKTLEEPPSYAHFILATTELWKIPTTIQSRCQRFLFRNLSEEDIIRQLQHIADIEHITIERTALREIALSAQGAMRDAIGMLDQLRSCEKITMTHVQERCGRSGQQYAKRALEIIQRGEKIPLMNLVQEVEEVGISCEHFLRELLILARQELHETLHEKKDFTKKLHVVEAMLTALGDIRLSPVPVLTVEALLLSLLPQSTGEGKWFFSLAQKETPIAHNEKKDEEPAKKNMGEIEAPDLNKENVIRYWDTIVQNVSPAAVKLSLKTGRVTKVENRIVTITFPSSFHRDKVAQIEASRHIESLLTEKWKQQLQIRCSLIEEGGASHFPQTEIVDLAQAAAEVF